MTVLALDLTATTGSVAIVRGEEVVAERVMESPDGFGHVVFDAMKDLLAQTGIALADMDAFAAATGPGSFTGVRVGLAAVKGLAEATGKAALGVSNLRALAACGTLDWRIAMMDARREEVYAAVYDRDDQVVVPDCVGNIAAFMERLAEAAERTPPYTRLQMLARSADWTNGPLLAAGIDFMEAPNALASMIGRLALQDLAAGLTGDPALLEANYVRRSDAELFWRE